MLYVQVDVPDRATGPFGRACNSSILSILSAEATEVVRSLLTFRGLTMDLLLLVPLLRIASARLVSLATLAEDHIDSHLGNPDSTWHSVIDPVRDRTTSRQLRKPSLYPKGLVEKQIDVIVGGLAPGGDSSSARKAYAQVTIEKRPRPERDPRSPSGWGRKSIQIMTMP
ncbi:hypothetical protein BHE74_00021744 [Ensete ventricosum]|nr:hypothetical protein BHE74_00021744 [Ensete ventricosum]